MYLVVFDLFEYCIIFKVCCVNIDVFICWLFCVYYCMVVNVWMYGEFFLDGGLIILEIFWFIN